MQFWCWIQEAWGWCTGMTQRDGMGRVVGGGFRMGNTGTPMADACWCMAKPIQYCKVQKKKKSWGRWVGKAKLVFAYLSYDSTHPLCFPLPISSRLAFDWQFLFHIEKLVLPCYSRLTFQLGMPQSQNLQIWAIGQIWAISFCYK